MIWQVIESGASKMIAEETFTDHTGHARIMQTIKIPFNEPGLNETAVYWAWRLTLPSRNSAKEEVARMRLYLKEHH
jgi:hypothetical protein